ncbi:17716_t:CDS:2 [Gigaspora margarita]|uniref:17716_t:CDS:1 n=1 Tax=Gigaspora margarita TaxID=4874 RepID=A0ABM8W3Y2_GIGMA|nr:17716_t:CDS:2 [Gigaspora margarita]
MEARTGKNVSISTMWRSLAYCGITRKKAAKERNELLRSAFMAHVESQYTSDQLVFLDESYKNKRTINRGYGYSQINTKAIKKTVVLHGKHYTILPALTLDSIIALSQMNTFPYARSVLILDNARIHHDDGLLEFLNAFGIRVEFLPPYSPDLNPIELAFSSIKSYLKRYQYFVESCSEHKYPLLVACSQITFYISSHSSMYFKKSFIVDLIVGCNGDRIGIEKIGYCKKFECCITFEFGTCNSAKSEAT